MITIDPFRGQPVLHGASIRLEPLTTAVLADYLRALREPEVIRLTGSHSRFEPLSVEEWLRTRLDHHDRADWAVVRATDGAFLGEAVLNDLDADDEGANFRIWLAGPDVFGRNYGTEATRLVIDYAFDQVGLHRLSVEVFAHNPRARRTYET